MKEHLSNWKEFENVVDGLELEGADGLLFGASVFLATDNTTVEGCLYKGNSTSEKLFDLVVRMKKLELKYGCQISVTQVSGLRMIAQGTDGVSRGQWKEGVTAGLKMLSFCPWGKTALEVAPRLKTWLRTWLPSHAEFLEPKDWFYRGHDLNGGQLTPWVSREIQ